MTRGELSMAGHPSLGTAVARAIARGEERASYVQQTPAGLQPIDVTVHDARSAHASMLQEPVEFGPDIDPAAALAAAGLDASAADPGLPTRWVHTGVWQAIVPVRREALADVIADRAGVHAVLAEMDGVTLYLAAVDGDGAWARSLYRDQEGVGEDPATGSAAGPLLALLHALDGRERLRVEQGAEMGRPSVLECSVDGDRVRVGGDVVVVATGTVTL
jgi:trans-2,3-dihydro-3-hydroxyanthranilate isomerase